MVNEQILTYLRENAASDRAVLVQQLRDAGYPEEEIIAAQAQLDADGVERAAEPVVEPALGLGGKLPGPIALLKEAWTLYVPHWKMYSGILLLPVLLLILAIVPIIGSLAGGRLLGDAAGASIFNWIGGLGLLAMVLIGLPAMLLIQYWGAAALCYTVTRGNEPVSFREAYKNTRKLVFPFLWIGIASSISIVGGFMLLIIPGILYYVWFLFSPFVLFTDGTRGMNALFTSREYVRGQWWPIFLRVLFLLAASWMVAIALFFALAPFEDGPLRDGLSGALSSIVTLVTTPLAALYIFAMFRHLKSMKGTVVGQGSRLKKALLIVPGIITPILLIVMPLFIVVFLSANTAQERGRDAKRLANLDAMRFALDVYAGQHNSVYPDVPNAPGRGPSAETFNALADVLVAEELLSVRPRDPLDDQAYVAQVNSKSNATSYILGADLETNQLACRSDYDGADLESPDKEPLAMCGEDVERNCDGTEKDGVDYCVCQGVACER